jgi:ATP-dependent helicase/DNAse subunit B
MGFSSILAGFIKELKQTFPLEPIDAIRGKLSVFFEELNIPDEISSRINDSLDVFAMYENALKKHNAADEDDSMAMAADLAGEHLKIDTLVLDGFYEINTAEERLIASLIRKAKHTVILIPISAINDDLSYCYLDYLKDNFKLDISLSSPESAVRDGYSHHAASSMEDEVETIARHIKGSFISGRIANLDEVFLVFPSLSEYREMVSRVFGRYGITHWFSKGIPLSKTMPCRDLLALLESILGNYPRLLFSRVLTSPCFRNIPASLSSSVPDICLDAGLVKGRENWLRYFREKKVYKECALIFRTLAPLSSLAKEGSYRHYVKTLKNVLRSMGFSSPDMVQEDLDDILDGLVMLDGFTDSRVDFSVFIDSLRRVLDNTPARTKAGGVVVAELFEVRGLEPKHLYLGGLRDGAIPSKPGIDLLLPETVRLRMGFSYLNKYLSLQEKIFRRLALSAGELYMSYPTMEGDKFYLPSNFLSGSECVESRAYGIFSDEEEMLKKGHRAPPLSEHIREVKGIRFMSGNKALNVTDIDSYRRCPRLFFIERVLGLEPSEISDYELEPRELGTIVHMVMERLIHRKLLDADSFEKLASEVLDEVLLGSDIDPFLKSLLRDSFIVLVPEIYRLEKDLRAYGYSLKSVEKKIEGEPIRGIRLKGKVDRIDEKVDEENGRPIQIIDYKTGGQRLSGSRVMKYGENLQLLIYAAILKSMGMKPERVGIYSLGDMSISWLPGKRDLGKGLSLDDYISSSLETLSRTVSKMREGDFTAGPMSEQTCRKCPERPYCPYIQGGRENN